MTSRRPRIFYGWWIVTASALISMYGAGVWFYGFPIFYKALLDEFGWTAAAGAAVVSLSRLEGGFEGPVIGWLIDRYGPRRLAIIGAVVTGLGFMAMSRVDAIDIGPVHLSSLVVFALLYAGWMSVGYNTGFSHASMAAVNAWFVRRRSRAFSLFSLGAGGSGLTVFLLGWLVDGVGWRTTAFIAGVGMFVIVVPLSTMLRRSPEHYGLLPDGDEPMPGKEDGGRDRDRGGEQTGAGEAASQAGNGVAADTGVRAERNFTAHQALRVPGFWMLVLSSGARSVAMTSVVVHQVVYLTDVRGISLVLASAALGATVFVSMIGRLGFGLLGDYVDKRYLISITYVLQAAGIFVLMNVTSMRDVWLFVVLYGIAYGGAIPLNAAIVGEYFGRASYATIRGLMQFFLMPATVIGPVYAGFVYDRTGSYEIAFTSFIVALLVGTVFMMLARRPALAPVRATERGELADAVRVPTAPLATAEAAGANARINHTPGVRRDYMRAGAIVGRDYTGTPRSR